MVEPHGGGAGDAAHRIMPSITESMVAIESKETKNERR